MPRSSSALTLVLLSIACAFLAGCEKSPSARLPGTYENEKAKATLVVTSDKIISSSGPLSLTADYKVVSVNGNVVTLELTAAKVPKKQLAVTVGENSLDMDPQPFFGGHWVRK